MLTRYVTSCKTMEPWEEWLGLGGGLLLEFSFQFDRENMSIFSCAAGYDVFVACCFQWDCARGGRVFLQECHKSHSNLLSHIKFPFHTWKRATLSELRVWAPGPKCGPGQLPGRWSNTVVLPPEQDTT